MSLSERRQERRHDHRSGFAPNPPRIDDPESAHFRRLIESIGLTDRPQPTEDDFQSFLASLGLTSPTGREDNSRTEAKAALKKIDAMLFTAFLLDIAAHAAKVKEQEQPKQAQTEPQTPFFRFWRKLGTDVDYGTAKRAFLGGETPVGAMTFIGKQWDGLRAVPSEPVTELGGKRPAYHGEYRVVDEENGTHWVKVTDKHDLPIAFGIPEAAITAAERERAEA